MGKRRANDFYPTPSWATACLLLRVPITGVTIECCQGDGAIADELSTGGVFPVVTNDIDDKWGNDYNADATDRGFWECLKYKHKFDWVVTNPPFNVASKIIPLAFEHAREGIAMMLRGSYTEPTYERQEWLAQHAENLSDIIYLPRISYTGDGKTDSVSANWYVWRKDHAGGCRVHWVCKPRKAKIPPLTTDYSTQEATP